MPSFIDWSGLGDFFRDGITTLVTLDAGILLLLAKVSVVNTLVGAAVVALVLSFIMRLAKQTKSGSVQNLFWINVILAGFGLFAYGLIENWWSFLYAWACQRNLFQESVPSSASSSEELLNY